MSELPTLKETIIDMLKRDSVPCMEADPSSSDKEEKTTPADRAYLASWLEHVENPIWSKFSLRPKDVGALRSYPWLVWLVLRVHRLAESVRSGADPMLELRQKERQTLLELAEKAAAIADYFRQQENPEIIACYEEFLRPLPELRRLHEKEANLFRARAGEEPKPTAPRVRQDRRKGRVGLRQRRAFITLMFNELNHRVWPPIDFTHVDAALARIAFREVDTEVVRKTLEPTTKEGRRQKRVASAQPGPSSSHNESGSASAESSTRA